MYGRQTQLRDCGDSRQEAAKHQGAFRDSIAQFQPGNITEHVCMYVRRSFRDGFAQF